MKNAFASKISYFILMFLFLIIIASFLFTGFDNFRLGGANDVASVDGTPVSVREYQNALSRQVEFFNQMMGGNGLTQKQLEEMGIKDSVISGLIQQKLILNAAKKAGIVVSMDEVRSEIRNMPYFKNQAGQFDVNQYRNALQMNGYTPTQFEELIKADLRQKKMDSLFDTAIVSDEFAKDVASFKTESVTLHAVKISRQSLSPLISVSEEEVKAYLAKPENEKAIEESYTDNASQYNQPEEVKARHILIKGDDEKALARITALRKTVNASNFAKVASAETEDATGTGNGGELGWFSKGRMVAEFEDVAFKMKKGEISSPVKTQFGYHLIFVEDKKAAKVTPLAEVREELARIAIQRTKPQDLDKLLKTQEEKITKALAAGNLSEIEALTKKVDGTFSKAISVNKFDQNIQGQGLSTQEAEKIFNAKDNEVVSLGNAGAIYLVKIVSKTAAGKAPSEEELKKEKATLTQSYSRKVREELLKKLNNNAKVVTNRALM